MNIINIEQLCIYYLSWSNRKTEKYCHNLSDRVVEDVKKKKKKSYLYRRIAADITDEHQVTKTHWLGNTSYVLTKTCRINLETYSSIPIWRLYFNKLLASHVPHAGLNDKVAPGGGQAGRRAIGDTKSKIAANPEEHTRCSKTHDGSKIHDLYTKVRVWILDFIGFWWVLHN